MVDNHGGGSSLSDLKKADIAAALTFARKALEEQRRRERAASP
jgi:hypothetical protein